MPEGNYRLAALDMDGTLLNARHEVSRTSRELLRKTAEAGGIVALCTGRCLSEIWAHLKAVPEIPYVICENGACIYDVRAGRALLQMALPEAAVRRVMDAADRFEVLRQCFMNNQSYMQIDDSEGLRRFGVYDFAGVFEAGSVYISDMRAEYARQGVAEKINLYFLNAADREGFAALVADLPVQMSYSLGTGYEISPSEATKARGLEWLCRYLGFGLENAVAVGDGGNDVDLMRAAGLAVAMGNAIEAVRAIADLTCEDCDHDGAALTAWRFLTGRR